MNREETRARFRQENPDVTDRVLTDAQLNSWLIEGNLNFSTQCRLITETVTIQSISGTGSYSLATAEPNLIDIDEFPGGGVSYNNKRITMTSKANLDVEHTSWRDYADGTPKEYFRRGEYIYFDRAPDTSDVDIDVDLIITPDDFNDDSLTPFNGLVHLNPYHYGLVLYVTARAKAKVGKDNDKIAATTEYQDYVAWCKKTVQGNTISSMRFVPPVSFIR